MKSIKQKIENNHLIITKADKGNTLIITYKDEYMKKIDEFKIANNFEKLPNDITNRHQMKTQINKYKHKIKKDEKRKFVYLNPSAPCLYGTIKLLKQGTPI
jgi:hypothetical protein